MLSYDGGGNDGVFNVFLAQGMGLCGIMTYQKLCFAGSNDLLYCKGQELWRIARKPLNLGYLAEQGEQGAEVLSTGLVTKGLRRLSKSH